MAQFKDGVTELIEGDGLGRTVDNVLVMPLHDGEADLILTHVLEESNGIVTKALIIGRWHFNSAVHLQQFSNMLAESIKRFQLLTDEELSTTREQFENTLKNVSHKIDSSDIDDKGGTMQEHKEK